VPRPWSTAQQQAERKDHVWTWDFIFDRTARGRTIKILSVVDEYTRECLALEVRRTLKAADVIDVLADLFVIRGAPKCIRSDNGPEFAAAAIREWLKQAGVETLYITPGSPWENGFVESFVSVPSAASFCLLGGRSGLDFLWPGGDRWRGGWSGTWRRRRVGAMRSRGSRRVVWRCASFAGASNSSSRRFTPGDERLPSAIVA
jgi:transposase InsO family protein